MSWTEERGRYEKALARHCPGAVLTTKDGFGWRALARVVYVLTLGWLPPERFKTLSATAVGPYVGVPRGWASIRPRVLAHEARHVRQYLRLGGLLLPGLAFLLGDRVRAWVGFVGWIVLAALPVPTLVAYVRLRLEMDAEDYAYRACLRDGSMSAAQVQVRARVFADSLAIGVYGWTWPRRWARKALGTVASRAATDRWVETITGTTEDEDALE